MARLVVPAAYPMHDSAADDGLSHFYVPPNAETNIRGAYRLAFSRQPGGGYQKTGPFAVSIYDINGQVFSLSLGTIRVAPPPADDDVSFEPFNLTTHGGTIAVDDLAVTGAAGNHRLYATFEWQGKSYEAYSDEFFLANLPVAVITYPPDGSMVGTTISLFGTVDYPNCEILIYQDDIYIGSVQANENAWTRKISLS